jgi:hypothetical protein
MARLVAAPSAGSLFGKGLFGNLSQATVGYLQGQIQSLAATGSDYGKRMYERSMEIFNEINSDHAVMVAESVLSQVESMMGQDMIEPLLTLPALQSARPIMQGWIMTSPKIRQGVYDGKLEGYSDTYVDLEPGLVGHEQSQYRVLMNGVLQPHEEASYQYSLYFDRTSNPDEMLTIRQAAAIVESQLAAEDAMDYGEQDPTSQYGASM